MQQKIAHKSELAARILSTIIAGRKIQDIANWEPFFFFEFPRPRHKETLLQMTAPNDFQASICRSRKSLLTERRQTPAMPFFSVAVGKFERRSMDQILR